MPSIKESPDLGLRAVKELMGAEMNMFAAGTPQ
jgi:hypothetical protein